MQKKLIHVTRYLNVGIPTLAEFLNKKGANVKNSPNAKINAEELEMLVNEFGKDLNSKEKSELLDKINKKPVQKTEQTKKEIKPSIKRAKENPKKIKTEAPKEMRPKLVIKGKINLELKKKPQAKKVVITAEKPKTTPIPTPTPPKAKDKKTEPKPESPKVVTTPHIKKEETKVEPVKEDKMNKQSEKKTEVTAPKANNPKVDKPKVVTEAPTTTSSATDSNKDDNVDGIFRLHSNKIESKVKVMGKIDLSTINQATRPKKKTKEERRKERNDKRRKVSKPGTTTANAANKTNVAAKPGETVERKKRNRIRRDRVDVNNTPGTNATSLKKNDRNKPRHRRPIRAEVKEEDVQKQVKETLARLTNKKNNQNRGAKYRRNKRDDARRREQQHLKQEDKENKVLKLTEFVTANELANMMDVSVTKVIGTCMSIGMMVSINQRLDAETINIVAEEFGFKTEYVSAEVVEAIKSDEETDKEEDLISRPPIVTVMGHVDHGKTSLLDNIRSANVIAGEAGGITQHIGAYNVKLKNGRRITFLDTPGHEAFTAMRARGAKVTDIAIIIVAADDSVMPQTIEAINHATAAGVPIVFAINKIDKPDANPEKIKEKLANMNYMVEEWGGKYQSQDISAKKGLGIDELLEKVLLETDMLELKANPNRRAAGSIIESTLDKGRGFVSTVLVENGTMNVGDVILAGTHFGKIKAMFNERNKRIDKVGPSEPALILGLDGAPQAGDKFNVMENEHEAREIATRREQLQRELGLRAQKMLTLDDIGRRIAVGNFQELNIIVKGDVDGSVEALSDSLIRLSTPEIQVNVIHKAVGQISESDVVLAAASGAIIIGFQVRPGAAARRTAEKDGVEIRLYSIIYDAINEVKQAMEGMLAPEVREDIVANVEVLQTFKITKVGTIAGCKVVEGKIKRTNKIRIIRDGIVVYSGELGSLKRFKDEVKEVVSGLECGLNIANYNDVQVGDIIEAYEVTEIKKKLQ